MCTSTGSNFCIRLTQRDNLDSDHQPMERGAHAITSERTRPTSQTVAPRGLSLTNTHAQPTEPKQHPARIFHFGESPPSVCPSLHHLQSPPPPPLHSLYSPHVRSGSAHRLLLGRVLTGWGLWGGAGELSPTACEREGVSCRDSAITADSVVAIGPQRRTYWLVSISAAVVPCASSSSSSSLHLAARNEKPMEGCRDVVHKEN